MNLKKYTKPTRENLMLMGSLGIFGFLLYSHAISQQLFILFSGFIAAVFSMASGSKYEINMREAELLAKEEMENRQTKKTVPSGTLSLASETALTKVGDLSMYIVSLTISSLAKKFTYLVKVTVRGTVVGVGRTFKPFSASDDIQPKMPKELQTIEKTREIGVPPQGEEKINETENTK